MMEYNDIIRQKVGNEIATFANKQEDDVTLLKEQKKQDFFKLKHHLMTANQLGMRRESENKAYRSFESG